MAWQPTTFKRYVTCFPTSTGVALIVTDAGEAYIKALGNREGPHALAREYVGTMLAQWFGLQTLEFAIMNVEPEDEIALGHDRRALPGPAFVTREIGGDSWGGSKRELALVENTEDFTKLVVFDTWVRNRDRHSTPVLHPESNLDNVFLTDEGVAGKKLRLMAIDNTHCFMPGERVTEDIAGDYACHDRDVYGLFPAFAPFVTQERVERCLEKLRLFDREEAATVVNAVPDEWDVSRVVRDAWIEFLVRRKAFLDDHLMDQIGKICWPGRLLDNRSSEATS